MAESARSERREVHYSGHVQGVGFRFTGQHVSRDYDVSGYVRNLPDGRVQLVAEGEPAELDRFLQEVERRMAGHIHNQTVDVSEASGEFVEFSIRH